MGLYWLDLHIKLCDIFLGLQVSISARLASALDQCLDSRDRISAVPYSRWDLDSLWRGEKTARARFGAFLPDVASFDCSAFGISIPEAELMDPQQRMLLEVRSWLPYSLALYMYGRPQHLSASCVGGYEPPLRQNGEEREGEGVVEKGQNKTALGFNIWLDGFPSVSIEEKRGFFFCTFSLHGISDLCFTMQDTHWPPIALNYASQR